MSPKLFDDRTARAEGDDPTTRTLARGPMYLLIGRKVDAPWIACRASCFQCGIGIDNWTYLTTRRSRILCFELLVPLVSKIVKESRNDFGIRSQKMRLAVLPWCYDTGHAILGKLPITFPLTLIAPFWIWIMTRLRILY